jgi:hypothetical protein
MQTTDFMTDTSSQSGSGDLRNFRFNVCVNTNPNIINKPPKRNKTLGYIANELTYYYNNMSLTPDEIVQQVKMGRAIIFSKLKEMTVEDAEEIYQKKLEEKRKKTKPGETFYPPFHPPGGQGYSRHADSDFISSNLIGIDVDNDDGNQKQKRIEDGYMSAERVIQDSFIQNNACLIYSSPSYTADWHRFRVIFVMPEIITDAKLYTRIAAKLAERFGGDKACKDVTRLFFGNTNALIQTFYNVNNDGMAEIIAKCKDDIKNGVPVETDKKEKNKKYGKIIEEGNRHPFLLSEVVKMTRKGLNRDQIVGVIKEVNQKRCNPPKTEKELDEFFKTINWAEKHIAPNSTIESRSEIQDKIWAMLNGSLNKDEKMLGIAVIISEWIVTKGKLFYTEERDFQSCLFLLEKNKQLFSICTDSFKAWLSDKTSLPMGDKPFKIALDAIKTEILVNGKEVVTSIYWETIEKDIEGKKDKKDKTIYISQGKSRIVKIDKTGIHVVDNGTDNILFKQKDVLKEWELVKPEDPFYSCRIFREMSCGELSKKIFYGWAYSLFFNPANKPPLCAIGAIGSGKSRFIACLMVLYGCADRMRGISNDYKTKDFWAAVNAGGFIAYDNVDTKIRWFPDALSSAVTGGGSEGRRLYTDSDIAFTKSRAWIALSSANPRFTEDPGLSDRLIVVKLERREGNTSDSILTSEVLKKRNAGMSYICTVLQKVVKDNIDIENSINQRHPDWGRIVQQIGYALDDEITYRLAVEKCEKEKIAVSVESDPTITAIIELCKTKSFVGTANQLLNELQGENKDNFKRLSVQGLAAILKNKAHILKEVVSFSHVKNVRGGTKVYNISGDEAKKQLQQNGVSARF